MKYIYVLLLSYVLLLKIGCEKVIEPEMIKDSPYLITFLSNRDNTNEGNYDVYIMDGNGRNVKRLTNSETNNLDPSFSKDGLFVYFQSNHKDNANIYRVDLNGNNLTNITNMDQSNTKYSLSNDGNKITFTHGDLLTNRDIYLMNLDGSNKLKLSQGTDWEFNSSPIFTYDDSKVAFVSYNICGPHLDCYKDIYCVNIDGSDLTNLTNHVGHASFLIPSPYEDIIVYMSDTQIATEGRDLYYIKLSNRTIKRITYNKYSLVTPRFFLNKGKSILFSSFKSSTSTISIVDLDGQNLRNLPIEGGVYDISPDEKYILIEEPPHSTRSEIYIADIDGNNIHQITNNNYSDKNPKFSSIIINKP